MNCEQYLHAMQYTAGHATPLFAQSRGIWHHKNEAPRGHRRTGLERTQTPQTQRYGMVGVRPRTRPTIAEMANRIIATKKINLAASTAKPAIPPKPSTAATKATIRNVTAQPSMTVSSARGERTSFLTIGSCAVLRNRRQRLNYQPFQRLARQYKAGNPCYRPRVSSCW